MAQVDTCLVLDPGMLREREAFARRQATWRAVCGRFFPFGKDAGMQADDLIRLERAEQEWLDSRVLPSDHLAQP